MINSINSGMTMPPPRTDQNLTEDQQSLISETLSQFDPESLNETEARSIIKAFSEAAIQPGPALEKAMSDFGFDAKTVGDLANINAQGSMPPAASSPPPPKQSTEEISSMVDYLTELLDEKLATASGGVLNDDDKQLILTQVFEKFGVDVNESIIDASA